MKPRHGLSIRLQRNLRLPAIAAPMFPVSGPEIAASRVDGIGSFPAPHARPKADLEDGARRIGTAGADDILASRGITGVTANWLKSSLVAAGYDPDNMPTDRRPNFADAQDDAKAWKNLWSAGQGVGAVRAIEPIADIISSLSSQYEAAAQRPPFNQNQGAIA